MVNPAGGALQPAGPPADLLDMLSGQQAPRRTFYPALRAAEARFRDGMETLSELAEGVALAGPDPARLTQVLVDILARHPAVGWAGIIRAATGTAADPRVWTARSEAAPARPPAASAAASDTDAVVHVPLAVGSTRLGTLVAACEAPCGFTEADRSLLATCAVQAATALHRADLAAAQQQRAADLRRVERDLAAARAQSRLEAERARIAGALHDTVAQQLISIGLHAHSLTRSCERHGQAAPHDLGHISALAAAALADVRSTIYTLASVDAGERDPATLLARTARTTAATHRLGVTFRAHPKGAPVRPSARIIDACNSATQEAIGNAARHGRAGRVWVTFSHGDGRLRLRIADDGDGDAGQVEAHLAAPEADRRQGLATMARRVRALGGEVAVRPGRRRGVVVILSAPCRHAQHDEPVFDPTAAVGHR